MATKNKSSKQEYPELYFIFTQRNQCIGDLGKAEEKNLWALSLYKDAEDLDDILSWAAKLGKKKKNLGFTTMIYPLSSKDSTIEEFEKREFIVTKATEQDFEEINREIDKIESIKMGQHRDYSKKYRDKYR